MSHDTRAPPLGNLDGSTYLPASTRLHLNTPEYMLLGDYASWSNIDSLIKQHINVSYIDWGNERTKHLNAIKTSLGRIKNDANVENDISSYAEDVLDYLQKQSIINKFEKAFKCKDKEIKVKEDADEKKLVGTGFAAPAAPAPA